MSTCCIISQLRYNSACVASFDELLKTTKKVTGAKEDMQLHFIQGLNELKMDTITRLTFWEEFFSTYVCELICHLIKELILNTG